MRASRQVLAAAVTFSGDWRTGDDVQGAVCLGAFGACIGALTDVVIRRSVVVFRATTLEARRVQVSQAVLADGEPLGAGTYEVRLTGRQPVAATGQSPNSECWVEFLQNGTVAGREVATVILASEIGAVAKGPGPKPEGFRVDVLKGGEYVRVWINRGGMNYIINLPPAS